MVPSRTTADRVRILLGSDYNGTTDLAQFAADASVVVDRVVLMAAKKGITLSSAELEMVERWLAAHLYQMNDPGYTSRSNGGASGSFDGGSGEGWEGTRYGRTAVRLDYSNSLRNMDKQQRAGGAWLGKPVTQQIPYEDRR